MPEFIQGVRVPVASTFRRYGLTRPEWEAMLAGQGHTCGVCSTVPRSGTLHIDHEHVRGWKKMPAEERRQYVRGLCCWQCNAVWLRRGATPQRLRAAADYLEAYLARRKENVIH